MTSPAPRPSPQPRVGRALQPSVRAPSFGTLVLRRGASTLPSTKQHVDKQRSEIGERALRGGLKLMTFRQSLEIDETRLEPEDLSRLKEEL